MQLRKECISLVTFSSIFSKSPFINKAVKRLRTCECYRGSMKYFQSLQNQVVFEITTRASK